MPKTTNAFFMWMEIGILVNYFTITAFTACCDNAKIHVYTDVDDWMSKRVKENVLREVL